MASDLNLSAIHMRTLGHLGRFNKGDAWCRLSQTDLAKMFGVSREAVNKAIKELDVWGYIEKRSQEQSGESFCLYRIKIDRQDDEGGVSAKADTSREGGVSSRT